MTVTEKFRSVVPRGGKSPLVAAVAIGIATSALTGEPPANPSVEAESVVGVVDSVGATRLGPAAEKAVVAREDNLAAEPSDAAGRTREPFRADARAIAGAMGGRRGLPGEAPGNSRPGRSGSTPVAGTSDQRGANPVSRAGSAGELVGFTHVDASGTQRITLVHTGKFWMAVYHIDGSGTIRLVSSRPIDADFSLQLNAASPLPDEIRQLGSGSR
jgi:hypothetical protein